MTVSICGIELRDQKSKYNMDHDALETGGTVYLNGSLLGDYYDDGVSILPHFGFDAKLLDEQISLVAPQYESGICPDYPCGHLQNLLIELSDLNDLHRSWERESANGYAIAYYGKESSRTWLSLPRQQAIEERAHARSHGRLSAPFAKRMHVPRNAPVRFFVDERDWEIGPGIRASLSCAQGPSEGIRVILDGKVRTIRLEAGLYGDGESLRVDAFELGEDGSACPLGELTVFDEALRPPYACIDPAHAGLASALADAGAAAYTGKLSISGYHILRISAKHLS